MELDAVEARHDVRVEVPRAAYFIEQLGGHRAHRDQAARPGVFRDDRRPVLLDPCDGKAWIGEIRYLGEEAVVATGGLGAALDDVTGHDCAGESVPVVARPAEVPGGRADHERGVRDAAGYDDIGTTTERVGDTPAAEVGVCRDGLEPGLFERLPAGAIDEEAHVRRPHQIVARHGGDRDPQTEFAGETVYGSGEPARIEPSRIGDHLDTPLETVGEDGFELCQEGCGIATGRIPHALSGEDRHRQLGEVVTGQHVDRPAVHHLAGRRHPVAEKPGAIGDADRLTPGHRVPPGETVQRIAASSDTLRVVHEARATLGKMQNPVRGFLHGAAALGALAGTVFLVIAAPTWPSRAAVFVFGMGLMALYTTSSLYHSIPWREAWKTRMQRADHSMIFVLIASTYTPIAAIALDGWLRWGTLAVVWAIAAFGVAHLAFFHNDRYHVSIALMMTLGWLAVFIVWPITQRAGLGALAMLLAGGVAYTVGLVFLVTNRPRLWPRVFSYHEVFHILVIMGSALHFAATYRYVVPLAA